MTGITNGLYRIRLAASPSPLVGVTFGSTPVPPVVTNGASQIWNFKRLEDGTFLLTLDGYPQSLVQGITGSVVANNSEPQFTWSVQGPDGGPYTIQEFNNDVPPLVWTVNDPAGVNAPVTLQPLQPLPLPENQKWYILTGLD